MPRPRSARRSVAAAALFCRLAFLLLAAPGSASAAEYEQAVNTDCRCVCKKSTDAAPADYHFAVGSRDECTDAACKAHFSQCPQYGVADDPDADEIAYAMYHDCTCTCCKQGECAQGAQELGFYAGSPDECTPDACGANFYACPDPGAHNVAETTDVNQRAMVFATYQDCTCACCAADACPTLTYNMFFARTPEACTADACSAKFYSCPDGGAHNQGGSVTAMYSGVMPEPPAPPLGDVRDRGSRYGVGAEATSMPTYGAALLSLFFIGIFGTLVGVFVHRRIQREKGFRWVMYEPGRAEAAGPGANANAHAADEENARGTRANDAAGGAAMRYEVGRS